MNRTIPDTSPDTTIQQMTGVEDQEVLSVDTTQLKREDPGALPDTGTTRAAEMTDREPTMDTRSAVEANTSTRARTGTTHTTGRIQLEKRTRNELEMRK